MTLLLQFLSLSDRYERKARLLPGLLVAATPALTIGAVVHGFGPWYEAAGLALTCEFLTAFVIGQLARARAKRQEDDLWKAWGGPPTTRWLRPWDETCSDQQKTKWRGAIKRLTGIVIPASVPEGKTQADVDRVIGDATRQLRYVLRSRPESSLLTTHNEDYGFARNLLAVRWLGVFVAGTCLVACGIAFAFGIHPYPGLAAALVGTLVALLVARELPEYVRRCSERYAESLFATAILVDGTAPSGGIPTSTPQG